MPPPPPPLPPPSSARSPRSPASRARPVPLTILECDALKKNEGAASASSSSSSAVQCRVLGGSLHLLPGSKAQVKLAWKAAPRTALLVFKKDDAGAFRVLLRVMRLLAAARVDALVENGAVAAAVRDDDDGGDDVLHVRVFDAHRDALDFCVCIGGDGTMLHLNSFLQQVGVKVPPVLALAMGSLGFLTPYDASQADKCIGLVMNGHIKPLLVSLRMRLRCELIRHGDDQPEFSYEVLNECLLDRGGSSTMSCLELLVDDELITLVQADGVIVSTPTGSTAYSMSAGGSMVAPTVPAILITPVCPHTLSFRPAVLPDASTVRLRVPLDARATCCVSFDGMQRHEVHRGDQLHLFMSNAPFPTISVKRFNTEWFNSIVSKLHWNVRKAQAPLPALL